MQIDEGGIDFIKSFEGFRAKPYQDQHGVWTIGFGHIDGVTEWTPAISEGQAELFLEEDLEDAEKVINRFVTCALAQNEFNALVSFVFNEGETKFIGSTLFRKLNGGDKAGAAKEFGKWIYFHDPATGEAKVSNGLVARRAKEAALFLSDLQTRRQLAQE